MTGDYFAHLNFAFSYSQALNIEPAARLVQLAILHKWNGFKRCRSFSLSDRELQSLTGLSSNAVTRSKRKLKNLGLIDFKATREGTRYFFTETPNTHTKATSNTPSETQTATRSFVSTASNSNIQGESKSAGAREEIWEM